MNQSQNAVETLKAFNGKLVLLKYKCTWCNLEDCVGGIRTKFRLTETETGIGYKDDQLSLLLDKQNLKYEQKDGATYFYSSTYISTTQWRIKEIKII